MTIAQPRTMGLTVIPGKKTSLPHALTMGTLHDPAFGSWNMVTEDPKEKPIEEEPLEESKEEAYYVVSKFLFYLSLVDTPGYYRRFIVNLSKITKPLASPTQKNQKYEWGMEQEEAFQTLKDNLCNTPILSLPDGPEDFVVYCDASNQGLGEASKVENATAEMLRGLDQLMERKEDGCMYFIWVSLIGDVRTLIMDEAHPGADKTYYDLRDMYGGHLDIPEWKYDRITMDFITRFSRSSSGYDTNWVIVDRLTKLAYFMVIREDYSMEKLARLYIDEIVAQHGVPVLIISNRYGRSPVLWAKIRESRLIGPELVQETTCKGAYRLRLPEELSSVHDIFHVSNLKKCLTDANFHVPLDEIKIDKTFHFVEKPVETMDREVKSLKRSKISIVKVRWNSKCGLNFTWERKDHMKANLLQRTIRTLHYEFAMTDLDRAHMDNCNLSRTPVDTESKLGSDGDPVSDPTLYRSLGDMVVVGQVRVLHAPSRY
nr:hypothetical protein [Tanacetum cinerariifolium]